MKQSQDWPARKGGKRFLCGFIKCTTSCVADRKEKWFESMRPTECEEHTTSICGFCNTKINWTMCYKGHTQHVVASDEFNRGGRRGTGALMCPTQIKSLRKICDGG